VNRIKAGGFAARCEQIVSGDIIESVDSHLCRGISQSELGALIMGPEGSSVRMGLSKGTEGVTIIQATRLRVDSSK